MIKIVLDTNIIISAALSSKGNPAQIINLIADKDEIQVGIITLIEKLGLLIEPLVSKISLPDESDRIFYDTALTSGSVLVTGNIKHFPVEEFIMTPAEFISLIVS